MILSLLPRGACGKCSFLRLSEIPIYLTWGVAQETPFGGNSDVRPCPPFDNMANQTFKFQDPYCFKKYGRVSDAEPRSEKNK